MVGDGRHVVRFSTPLLHAHDGAKPVGAHCGAAALPAPCTHRKVPLLLTATLPPLPRYTGPRLARGTVAGASASVKRSTDACDGGLAPGSVRAMASS